MKNTNTYQVPIERLDDLIAGTPHAHLRILYSAIRHGGCGLASVPQGKDKFPAEHDRPAIFLIGDDTDTSLGPDGFHRASLRRAIKSCAAFSVISCEAVPTAYGAVAGAAALLRQNVMIVETRLAHEADWYNLISKLAPGVPILLATVKPAGRA